MRLTGAILAMLPLLVAQSICAPVQPRAVTDVVMDKSVKVRDEFPTWGHFGQKARDVEPHKDEPDWKARDVEPHKDEPDW